MFVQQQALDTMRKKFLILRLFLLKLSDLCLIIYFRHLLLQHTHSF